MITDLLQELSQLELHKKEVESEIERLRLEITVELEALSLRKIEANGISATLTTKTTKKLREEEFATKYPEYYNDGLVVTKKFDRKELIQNFMTKGLGSKEAETIVDDVLDVYTDIDTKTSVLIKIKD
jgi:N-acetyl-gamma-glutamylphosphate reductase